MLRKFIYVFLALKLLSIPFFFFLFREKPRESVLSRITPVYSDPVNVSGLVGAGYMIESITGWSSPFSEVNLSSPNLIRKTVADESGFFAFYLIPAPENLGEICLVAQDVNQLPSYPVCLSKIERRENIKIENILLPPTLFLEGGQIIAGKTVKASGMTFPDTTVDVYLFTERKASLSALIRQVVKSLFAKPANAFGLPVYRVKSNKNGYFEFSLPASYPSLNRIFVASSLTKESFEESHSPKSFTLAFETIGFLKSIFLFLLGLIKSMSEALKSPKSISFYLIILEILALAGLLFLILFEGNKAKKQRN
ncbi:hypothetical protein C4578_02525 [Candidatus Microgenomates bacterium]|jgi:hypothetical protein|nr:MAG: hypothetical protein C4578_02525 [Candidatus Microgenomates bacterium]